MAVGQIRELGSRRQHLRVDARDDPVIVPVQQGHGGAPDIDTSLGGRQEGVVDRDEHDQMPHRISAGILDSIAAEQVESVAKPIDDRTHLTDAEQPPWNTECDLFRKRIAPGLKNLTDPALRIGQEDMARGAQRLSLEEIRQPVRAKLLIDDWLVVVVFEPEEWLQILRETTMVGEQAGR
jgi:hypothetical protein